MHSFCENRLVALIWRLAGLSIGTYGLILMLQASSVKQQLCYFTNQSNLFILILFAGLAVQTAIQIGRNGIHGPVAHTRCRLHLALTLYITMTMVCYWALHSWQSFSMAGVKISQFQMKLSNFILHTAVPIFALVDWMLFLPHGRVRPRAAVYFLAYPIEYSIFIALRAQFGGYLYGTVRYPYPFADPDLLGWPVTLLVAALLLLVYYAMGRMFIALDCRMTTKKESSPQEKR